MTSEAQMDHGQAQTEQDAAERTRQRGAETAQQRWEANEKVFQRDRQRVARLVSELPFGAIFAVTIKAIIAFWLANLLIGLVVWGVLLALGGSLAGFAPQ